MTLSDWVNTWRQQADPRPHKLCDCHAMVSGVHTEAAKARAVLAWYERRIDDCINGCWLPRNTDAKKHMPTWLIGAVPHSRIHRFNYYFWLNSIINADVIESEKQLIEKLAMIEFKLQTSTFPRYVMLPKGKGL